MHRLIVIAMVAVALAGCDELTPAPIANPVARFSAEPTSGPAPLVVVFDASESHTPNGSIVSFEWTFGDGTGTGTGNATPTHVYASSGTYTVRLTVTDARGGTDETSSTIRVLAGSGSGSVVEDVTIDGGDRQLAVGDTVLLSATVHPSDDVDQRVVWNSSVSGVASVDATGLVTGIATGVANITATSVADSAMRASVQVTVTATPAIDDVRIDQRDPTLMVGDQVHLTASVTAIAGADPALAWTSDHAAVVTVDDSGFATAIATGEALIRATSVFDATRSDSVRVSVIDASSLDFEFGRELIAAGASHTLFIGDDGAVWAWGTNAAGQLGVDTVETVRRSPVHVPGVAAAVSVAAGAAFSLVTSDDGRVLSWGEGRDGQLGDGTLERRHVPEAVPGLGSVMAVAAGSAHALALHEDGTLYAWGKNDKGQLGDGSNTDRGTPTRVGELIDIVAIAAGANHSLAVTEDGAVWAWGANDAGQLGDGTTANRNEPVEVGSLPGMRGVAAGSTHSIAVDTNGRLWAWGHNLDGQLGDGTTDARTSPVPVETLSAVVSVSAGEHHTVAVRHDGSVWAWGRSSFGQLGDGTEGALRSSPIRVGSTNDARMVAAGGLHSVVVTTDGALRAWGRNTEGQLGISRTSDVFSAPEALRERRSKVTAVSVGWSHSLAVVDGSLWSWGWNRYGALGHGTSSNTLLNPRAVAAMPLVSTIAVGLGHASAAIDAAGDLWTWGANSSGVLGHGSWENASSPTRVPTVSNVADVTIGQSFMIARSNDGTLWAWGVNSSGQLGIGSTTSSSTPVQLTSLTSVTRVAAGADHAIALRGDGTVWAWGQNAQGALGDGTTVAKSVPTPVHFEGNPRITAVAAGDGFSVALDDLGNVWAWGKGYEGQLGNGSWTRSLVPTRVPSLTSVEAIAVGTRHVLALRTDGTVWAWGANDWGQLGLGVAGWPPVDEPTHVPGLDDVHAIAAEADVSMAIRRDGRVWGWGRNSNGTLGDGTTRSRYVPVYLW